MGHRSPGRDLAAVMKRPRISRKSASAMREGIALARLLDDVRELRNPLATAVVMDRVVDMANNRERKLVYAAFVVTNNRLMMDRAFDDREASR